nr:C-C motif chemokine 25 isoform X5 [Mirounga angustirostris]
MARPTEADGRRWPKSRAPCRAHAVCLAPVFPAAAAASLPDTRGGRAACTMNPWLVLCLVASLVGAWSTIHAQGVSEDCCLAYHSRVRPGFLRYARSYRRQEVSGSCNLPAVIFFFPKNKTLCANPRDSWVPKMVDFLDAGNKTLSKRHWRHLQVILFGARKSSIGISKLPLPKVSRFTRSDKENYPPDKS